MKQCSRGTGSPTNSAQSNTGELSRPQRAILRTLRNDGPGTEAEIYSTSAVRYQQTMDDVRAALHDLELRSLVRCDVQPNGRRIWGSA